MANELSTIPCEPYTVDMFDVTKNCRRPVEVKGYSFRVKSEPPTCGETFVRMADKRYIYIGLDLDLDGFNGSTGQ